MSSFLLAYIDAGSGTLLLQMVVAGVVSVVAYFRGTIFGFLGFFKRSKSKDESKENLTPKP